MTRFFDTGKVLLYVIQKDNLYDANWWGDIKVSERFACTKLIFVVAHFQVDIFTAV